MKLKKNMFSINQKTDKVIFIIFELDKNDKPITSIAVWKTIKDSKSYYMVIDKKNDVFEVFDKLCIAKTAARILYLFEKNVTSDYVIDFETSDDYIKEMTKYD